MGSLVNKNDAYFSTLLTRCSISAVWRVMKFSSLGDNADKFIVSPDFGFKSVTWQLKVCNESERNGWEGVFVFLQQLEECKKMFKWRIYMSNENGRILRPDTSTDYLKTKETVAGFFFAKDLVECMYESIHVDKTITIGCEVLDVEETDDESSFVSDDSGGFVVDRCDCTVVDDLRSAYDDRKFTDVIVKAGGQSFPAHKLILSSRSKVFQAMFQNDMKEKEDNVVDLVEMDPAIARAMLIFMYSGEVSAMSGDQTLELYAVAERYMLAELKEKCGRFFVKSLSVDNVCDIAAVADLHSDYETTKAVRRFFAVNVKEILTTEKWTELSSKNPKYCLELLKKALLSNHFL